MTVVSRNDLIRLKAATGRDRDLLDIGDLLALDEQRHAGLRAVKGPMGAAATAFMLPRCRSPGSHTAC